MTERLRFQRGVGLVEVMISVIIGMLLVLVIYQVYEVSEGQKRTITAGSDAQQNASYGLYVLTRDLSMAGNGIASAASALDQCAKLRPIPVLIEAGAAAGDSDTLTVFYGGSSSLSTPVQFKQTATIAEQYIVPGPVGFSANDVVAAVQGASCTLSRVNPGGVAISPATGFATLTHTPLPGEPDATYLAGLASLVNLGQETALGRIAYSIATKCKDDPTACALRTQNLLPIPGPVLPKPVPVVSDAVYLTAQYGVDTDGDRVIDDWKTATGIWSGTELPKQPLATLRQIRAVRVAIVTRSAQWEKDAVTTGPLTMLDDTVTMAISGDQQHYRYKVLETVVPLRNALWNSE